ncbi:Protein Brevis radix-like 1 [Glycine soja]|nr:Protein Brevis radix-like 1 [Glycine soja]
MSRTDTMTTTMTADLNRTGPVERDIEQDESVLIWFSGKEEKRLKLTNVSRIISGQRTPIFQRYPRPEKEYQSFSLIYNDRSLDLICKDKDEAEVWFSGLKALISRGHHWKWRPESRTDGIPSEANSPRTYTRRSSPLNSPFGSNESLQKTCNCYNCGLVFCHSCSNKKSVKASMAPNPNKPYRVCDNCFNKIRKTTETDSSSQASMSRRGSVNQGSLQFNGKDDKLDSRSHNQLARFSSMESLKQVDSRSSKKNKKLEFNSSRVSPAPNGGSQWGAMNISKSFNPVFGSSKKFFSASVPGSRIVSRATSPISRRPSPPRSTTPTPTLGGLSSPKIVVDDAKRINDNLSQEVVKLRSQVENLTRKAQLQEVELERTTKQLKEAIAIASEETAKCKAAKEVIKSLTAQWKDMAERLPVGASRNARSPPSLASFGLNPGSNDLTNASFDRLNIQATSPESDLNGSTNQLLSNGSSTITNRSAGHIKHSQSDATSRNGSKTKDNETEWVEQDEPGVYITLTSLPGGVIDLKRVRFSRKRFSEKQAEQWWAENRARVYEQYNVHMIDKSTIGVGSEDLAH